MDPNEPYYVPGRADHDEVPPLPSVETEEGTEIPDSGMPVQLTTADVTQLLGRMHAMEIGLTAVINFMNQQQQQQQQNKREWKAGPTLPPGPPPPAGPVPDVSQALLRYNVSNPEMFIGKA